MFAHRSSTGGTGRPRSWLTGDRHSISTFSIPSFVSEIRLTFAERRGELRPCRQECPRQVFFRVCERETVVRLRLIKTSLALACAFPALAERLPDLIAEALKKNPEVLAAQTRWEAARQRPSQERSLPDPMLSLSYASNGGPFPGQGLGSNATSNIGLMISQDVPYPGKRKLRADIAAKEADVELQQYRTVQLNVRSRVEQVFHRLHHTYAMVEILEHDKDLVTRTMRVSEIRYAAGKTMQQDILKAQTQLSMLEIRIVRMVQDRRAAEAELNSLLNRAPGSVVEAPTPIEDRPLSMTLEDLIARANEETPELKRDQKMIERGELAVNLARKDFHSDYTIAAGYFNQGGMPPMFQVRVDVPLKLHAERRERPALNEQVDRLAQARRELEAADQSFAFRIREAYSAAETAWRLMQLYTDTVLPQCRLTVESATLAYENAVGDFLPVLSALATSADAEEQLHEEELNYQLAVTRLEEMTGVKL